LENREAFEGRRLSPPLSATSSTGCSAAGRPTTAATTRICAAWRLERL